MTPESLLEAIGPVGPVLAAALGLIFGSFANVCIHRLPEDRSVVRPGSACPACGAPIRWYDNIPVLSWLVLGGRCRGCHARIPFVYPAIELITGALFLLLYLQQGPSVRWMALCWMAASIVILVPIDLRFGILPDKVTLPGLAIGLLLSPLGDDPGPSGALAGALAGALVPLGIRTLYMLYVRVARGRPVDPDPPAAGATLPEADEERERREGMGLGDVKMLAMVGAFLGMPRVLLTMLLGSVIGTFVVLPMVALGRQNMKTAVPFGPFLGIAAIVSMFWGSEIIRWYLQLVVALPSGG